MGPENLTAVVSNGEYKISQYLAWGGEPLDQGRAVINFLNTMLDNNTLDIFKEKVDAAVEISKEEYRALWAECGLRPDQNWVGSDIIQIFKERYPHLHRDCSAGILNHVLNAPKGIKVELNTDFAADSLFCEWAYVINLDNNVLEVYSGGNNKPLPNDARFKFLERSGSEYYPVVLIATYNFDELPQNETEFTKWAKELDTIACGIWENEKNEGEDGNDRYEKIAQELETLTKNKA